MSRGKEEEYVPEPFIEYTSKSKVASWPITSLRPLVSALNNMGCTVSENEQLLEIGMADARLKLALDKLKEESGHGDTQQTKDTISLIKEVEIAAGDLRIAQKSGDAARPEKIQVVSSTGREFELSLTAGSYVVRYSETEVFEDGRLIDVVEDSEARSFVNELTHSYCIADKEHKDMISNEDFALDEVTEDLRLQLRKATTNLEQWEKVQEVTRIRTLIRERKEFLRAEAKKLGHTAEEYEFDDEICFVITDSGPKLQGIREREKPRVGRG
tara:strand:- start:3048 stop:3860 length:813 start_codon:yes stop_codon:yes gene_type:complete